MMLRATISRRTVLAIGLMSVARPGLAELRPGSYRIGWLFSGAELTPDQPWVAAFLKKLEQLGYENGKNLSLVTRVAGGQFDRLPSLAAELMALHPDVIMVTTTPALLTLHKANCPIPVVYATGMDPVQIGVAESLAHPGGNFTGIWNISTEITSKRVQMLRDLLPHARRIVCFINPKNSPANTKATFLARLSEAASNAGFEATTMDIVSGDDLAKAFAAIKDQNIDALLGLPDPILFQNRKTIMALARDYKLPVIYTYRLEAEEGGLIAYGSDFEAQFLTMAIYVDKILRGERPGDLPIDQASNLALAINMKTAKELGLEIPQVLLAEADEVIE